MQSSGWQVGETQLGNELQRLFAETPEAANPALALMLLERPNLLIGACGRGAKRCDLQGDTRRVCW